MFRITEDPSSESLVQCLAKSYKNDSIMSTDMDKVDAMVAYSEYILYIFWNIFCIYSEIFSEYILNIKNMLP